MALMAFFFLARATATWIGCLEPGEAACCPVF